MSPCFQCDKGMRVGTATGTELAWGDVTWVKHGLASGALLEKEILTLETGICHSPRPIPARGKPRGWAWSEGRNLQAGGGAPARASTWGLASCL